MLILVTGGSCSGKSGFAEGILAETGEDTCKYYIATMEAADSESKARVARHRAQRAGKGFVTIEMARDICMAAQQMRAILPAMREWTGELAIQMTENDASKGGFYENGRAALLECMSNLVANEMFGVEGVDIHSEEAVVDKVCRDIALLEEKLDILVVVTNNVFEDGVQYDEGTMAYLRALGRINVWLAERAEQVYEVVVGIPVLCK